MSAPRRVRPEQIQHAEPGELLDVVVSFAGIGEVVLARVRWEPAPAHGCGLFCPCETTP